MPKGTDLHQTKIKLEKWWKDILEQNKDTGESPYLTKISITGQSSIRKLQNVEIEFKHPLTVLCGKNGTGKTTALNLASLAFSKPDDSVDKICKNYKFADFFHKGITDSNPNGVSITWEYKTKEVIESKSITKNTQRWMRYNTRSKKHVLYMGLSRCVPSVELKALRSVFKIDNPKIYSQDKLNETFTSYLSQITSKQYEQASQFQKNNYALRACATDNLSYSSFNMGAGEDVLLEILIALQNIPRQSLLIIEEIEVGIHGIALSKLMEVMLNTILEKKLQVIVSTHSPEVIKSVPNRSLVYLDNSTNNIKPIYMPSVEVATYGLTGDSEKELLIICEDLFAKDLINQAVPYDFRTRINITAAGDKSQLCNFANIYKKTHPQTKIIIVWDGDVYINEINNYLKSSLDQEYCKLPGDCCPERYCLQILNDEEGHQKLSSRFNIPVEKIDTIIKSCLLQADANILFYLSSMLCMELSDVKNSVIQAFVAHPNSGMQEIVDKIQDILPFYEKEENHLVLAACN